ncbi:hypothetical protein L1987_84873 [Smallanthus sonchifolius]|uniref:Uncharacterized protein n=1 Tax=Smallanthus sonchifolius TaxID=185202 RepID=A0ACB8XUZ2_9ASTR|nr:hypothetical protein L1987_84873 [Smallanthus sonchifolius]
MFPLLFHPHRSSTRLLTSTLTLAPTFASWISFVIKIHDHWSPLKVAFTVAFLSTVDHRLILRLPYLTTSFSLVCLLRRNPPSRRSNIQLISFKMQQPTATGNSNSNGNGADLTPQQQQQQQQWLAMQQYQQQQWMAMQQYPPAAAASMGMHHPAMMYQQAPPQYMPYHYQQQYQQQQQQQHQTSGQIQSSSEDNKTIWVGDLQHWMDETYLQSCFSQIGEVQSIKVIRNKQTGQSERYGFIEFLSHSAAEKVIQSYNGAIMPNTDQVFRLNWASFSTGDKRG